jgi:hypothetical protein
MTWAPAIWQSCTTGTLSAHRQAGITDTRWLLPADSGLPASAHRARSQLTRRLAANAACLRQPFDR